MKYKNLDSAGLKNGSWYLVRCPEYSESGHEVAQYIDGEFVHGHFSVPVNDFVIGFYDPPLN